VSELAIIPCVVATNGVPRRFADAERFRPLDRSEGGSTDLCDDLPVQLRELGTTYVLGVRDYLKVIRTNARRIVAKMIQHQSWGNGADFLLVESAVGAVLLTGDPDRTVTPLVLPASVPDPAGSVVPAICDRPEVRRHLEAFGCESSAVTREEAAWLSLDESLALEGALDQVGFFPASTVTKHSPSVSKGGGSY
jgi:hypothetical protein